MVCESEEYPATDEDNLILQGKLNPTVASVHTKALLNYLDQENLVYYTLA